MLEKFSGNPILKPIPEHSWESKSVFNCASFYDAGRVHLVYRAMGEKNVSYMGYASSLDGFTINERLGEPIFCPEEKLEIQGCEDPRITRLGDNYHMSYAAFDGRLAQMGLTSIKVEDFLKHKWHWKKRIYPFPGVHNKDVVLFPERIGGRWVIYHRIPPHIWVAYSRDLVNWENSNIVIMPRGKGWESLKVGAGAPPLKTPWGWLFVYHAVDKAKIYRLGLALVDLNDPEKIIYRSEEPILIPDKDYEQSGDVPYVVFTCGALIIDGILFVYYGGADKVICVATQEIEKLLPSKIRTNEGVN